METDRLLLRALTRDDADVVFPHYANEEIVRYEDSKAAATVADAVEIINWGISLAKNGTGGLWGLFRKGDNQFLGSVNYVTRRDNSFTSPVHRCEIGYDLTPEYWGNGYMSEAVRSVVDDIFRRTKINRIEATVHPANTRSLNVLTRLGFQVEGLLREYVEWEGKYWDMTLFSMLKKDWDSF